MSILTYGYETFRSFLVGMYIIAIRKVSFFSHSYDSNPSSVEAPTSIYRYNEDEDKFELFQELTNTEITLKLSNFVLSGKQYLFVSTYQVFGGSKITNSSLFVYQNATGW